MAAQEEREPVKLKPTQLYSGENLEPGCKTFKTLVENTSHIIIADSIYLRLSHFLALANA